MLSVKTRTGYECFGEYYLGTDPGYAFEIFSGLKGNERPREQAALHFDFMEIEGDLPAKVKTISCTLDEFIANCKSIAKEVFRLNNLKELL
jgi:hypothetical protein